MSMRSTRSFFWPYLSHKTLKQVLRGIGQRRLPGLAAEMAYNNLLALFPVIVALLAAIGLLDIAPKYVNFLAQELLQIAPEQVLSLLRDFITQVSLPEGKEVIVVSLAAALWVASNAMGAAMNAMDEIHQIAPSQRRSFSQSRFVSLGLTIATLSLYLIASFLIFISDVIVQFLLDWLQISSNRILPLWNLVRWLGGLASIVVAFGAVYRHGPSRWRSGDPLLPGALLAALLWAASSKLFRFYVGHFDSYNLTYGALGAAIVLLLWLNFSSLAMLIGAQFNVVVGRARRADPQHY